MAKGILKEDGDGGSDLFRRVRQGLTDQVTWIDLNLHEIYFSCNIFSQRTGEKLLTFPGRNFGVRYIWVQTTAQPQSCQGKMILIISDITSIEILLIKDLPSPSKQLPLGHKSLAASFPSQDHSLLTVMCNNNLFFFSAQRIDLLEITTPSSYNVVRALHQKGK